MPRATGTTRTARTTRTTRTTRTSSAVSGRRKATVPAQRRSEIEALGLGVEELVVAEHEAQDARLFHALEWSAE
jgi:hypothetical protein